jgi:hypothetical protein
MPEQPDYPADPAPVRGAPKHVYLSDQVRTGVQAWADREGVSFSAALGTLARLDLREDPCDAWSPVLSAKLLGAVRAELGHHRALLAATTLDAGIAARMASAAAKAKALRPRDYPRMKRLARLEAVAALRRRDALSRSRTRRRNSWASVHAASAAGACPRGQVSASRSVGGKAAAGCVRSHAARRGSSPRTGRGTPGAPGARGSVPSAFQRATTRPTVGAEPG